MNQDEFAGDGVDLYDDVIAAPPGGNGGVTGNNSGAADGEPGSPGEEANGNAPYHQMGNNIQPNQIGRRHQLYIGNLTWVNTFYLKKKKIKLIITQKVELSYFYQEILILLVNNGLLLLLLISSFVFDYSGRAIKT